MPDAESIDYGTSAGRMRGGGALALELDAISVRFPLHSKESAMNDYDLNRVATVLLRLSLGVMFIAHSVTQPLVNTR